MLQNVQWLSCGHKFGNLSRRAMGVKQRHVFIHLKIYDSDSSKKKASSKDLAALGWGMKSTLMRAFLCS